MNQHPPEAGSSLPAHTKKSRGAVHNHEARAGHLLLLSFLRCGQFLPHRFDDVVQRVAVLYLNEEHLLRSLVGDGAWGLGQKPFRGGRDLEQEAVVVYATHDLAPVVEDVFAHHLAVRHVVQLAQQVEHELQVLVSGRHRLSSLSHSTPRSPDPALHSAALLFCGG